MRESLPRRQRLRGASRFDALFAMGQVGKGRHLVVRALANGAAFSRLAAVAGKALGDAVLRNRLRRRLRAAFRGAKAELPAGWDFVLLARGSAATAPFPALLDDVRAAVRKAIATPAGAGGREPRRSEPKSERKTR